MSWCADFEFRVTQSKYSDLAQRSRGSFATSEASAEEELRRSAARGYIGSNDIGADQFYPGVYNPLTNVRNARTGNAFRCHSLCIRPDTATFSLSLSACHSLFPHGMGLHPLFSSSAQSSQSSRSRTPLAEVHQASKKQPSCMRFLSVF